MAVPERWQDLIELLLAPIAWMPRLQEALIAFFPNPAEPWAAAGQVRLLAVAGAAGRGRDVGHPALGSTRCRSARAACGSSRMMLLAWWDAARAVTVALLGRRLRVAGLAVGWVVSLAALVVRLLWSRSTGWPPRPFS